MKVLVIIHRNNNRAAEEFAALLERARLMRAGCTPEELLARFIPALTGMVRF